MKRDTIELVSKHNLREALSKLGETAGKLEHWQLKSEIDNLETTYNYMLQYASQGVNDPSRNVMYNNIVKKIYALTRMIDALDELKNGSRYLSRMYRTTKNSKPYEEALEELESAYDFMITTDNNGEQDMANALKKVQAITDELFTKIWMPVVWSKEDYQSVTEMIDSDDIDDNVKAVIIAAVGLSLIGLMDPYKTRLLIHSYIGGFSSVVSQRALTCLIISLLYTEGQIEESYDELNQEFKALSLNPDFADDIQRIIKQLILSLDTEEIDKKMRDEIIPSIMKSSYFKKSVEDIIELKSDEFTEKNPQWQSLKDNIKELDNLRMEGADTNMGAFSQLKRYQFFNNPAHWFYPYSTDTPEIYELMSKPGNEDYKAILEAIMEFPDMCNSDRYSLCLTLKDMAQFPMDGLKEGLTAQYNMMKEKLAELGDNNKMEKETVSRHFIQDYYRFCKLWASKEDKKDIFTDKLTVWKPKLIYNTLEESGHLKSIADYLFSKDYISEALEIYRHTVETNPNDVESLQKIGYAYIKSHDYELAVDALDKANMLEPDNEWTLKNLAVCYKKTGNAETALKYLKEAETLNPDDIKLCNQTGITLIQLERFDEAIKQMYKVEYFSSKKNPARRAIAWCYFMSDKLDEASEMLGKIIETDDVRTDDYINLGHIYLLKSDIPKAIEYYKKSSNLSGDKESFHEKFSEDADMLKAKGISEEMTYMIPDMVCM